MSQRDPIRVFITHAWEQSDDYLRVFEYLESARNFYYRNCSNPEQRPVTMSVEGQREELRTQMQPAEVVVALSSLYAAAARPAGVPAAFRQGQRQAGDPDARLRSELALPRAVTELVDVKVGWDERALVDEIRRQARHEETTRWDTIEFKID